ncbi:MAG: hypothetical protein J0G28_13615 [Afipia sp.]|nr:hypothetical protein [Afipia sp.]OJW61459.1 MAG: hypothetical protein BGO65_10630 [Afipia sp. 64-13]
MPRYFFHTRIGGDLISDPQGADLRDPDQAWEVARVMIRQLLREGGRPEAAPRDLITAILEVTDEAGEIVLEFPFSEVLIDPADRPPTTH